MGLIISDRLIAAQSVPYARVFEYPNLDNVFIMENDLYGTTMPEHLCFIAFKGRHGLVGMNLAIEELKNYSVREIQKLVADNSEG